MKKVEEILQRYVDEIDRTIEEYLSNDNSRDTQIIGLYLRAKRSGFTSAINLIHSEGGNDNEKELIYLYNKIDRIRNEVAHQKAEKKKVIAENRRIKESNAQLVGEKMQLRKELNRYKETGLDYEVT